MTPQSQNRHHRICDQILTERARFVMPSNILMMPIHTFMMDDGDLPLQTFFFSHCLFDSSSISLHENIKLPEVLLGEVGPYDGLGTMRVHRVLQTPLSPIACCSMSESSSFCNPLMFQLQ
jgi:hypothetical protein